MKYAHLIYTPTNEGKNYVEYRAAGKQKRLLQRKVLLARLKEERAERIKKFGKIKIPRGIFGTRF